MKKIFTAGLLLAIMSFSCSNSPRKIDKTRSFLAVEFAFNTASYHSFIKKFYPQIAVWINQGTEKVHTVYVTAKGAKEDWFGADRRPSALPVWRGIHRSDIKIDSVSGATPSGSTYRVEWNLPEGIDSTRPFEVYVEANISFDYNKTWPKDAPENSPGWSGVNGQPSLLWQGTIDPKKSTTMTPQLIGRGSVTGKDSQVYKDLSGITTARDIFSYIKVILVTPTKSSSGK